jgi:signal transduction histidine kinase
VGEFRLKPKEINSLKKSICSAILALSLLMISGLASAADDPSRQTKIIFAGSDDFAPYSFYSEENEASGFSVDLVKILSASMNREISIKLMPWEQCIAEIKAGRVQGLIGSPVNAEWDRFMDFSEPVAEIEYAIFVEASNSYVNSLRSLEGTVVAVHKGSIIIGDLKKQRRLTLLETDSIKEGFLKLLNHEVTAVIAEKNVALYYIQRDNIEDIKIVGHPIQTLPFAVAVQQNNSQLMADVQKSVLALKANDTLSKLQRKWLGMKLAEPFPWMMFFMATSGITVILIFFATILWVVSLNATVKAKTQQIQIMSQKMVEKDKLAVLGKLAGQIAHELRTPLSIINNSVFLLRKEGGGDKEMFEKRLRVLEEKIKLSSNILESILSYSRVKAEVASMISIRECVQEVLKDLQCPPGIEQSLCYPDTPLFVFMDFHQLYSVIRNIALNALQAMGDTGKLSISILSSDEGSTVSVRIADTGGGIAESARNKIFSLFYSTKITGTGLGLPISKSIIEANGGSLSLEETNEKGTVFTVKLPSAKTGKR